MCKRGNILRPAPVSSLTDTSGKALRSLVGFEDACEADGLGV